MTAPTCPACGDAVEPGERFCGTCGAGLVDEARLVPGPSIEPPAAPRSRLAGATPAPSAAAEPIGQQQDVSASPRMAEQVPARVATVQSGEDRVAAVERRPRDVGLAMIRLALGLAWAYPRNPLFHGADGQLPGTEGFAWSNLAPVEFWAGTAVRLFDMPFLGVVAAVQLVTGVLIVVGVWFRTVCAIAALTWLVIVGYVVVQGSSFEMQLAYALTALAFAGLGWAGPGRWRAGGRAR
ncbi:MAG: DoxX family protein [Acidobacteria bacterium]|jgi:uncharacterized membrane protein YphA (DoxX/SURF4 family)|nr:DoxX family protein [Acidobacteriota bacterium]